MLACGGAYWPMAFEPSAMTSKPPHYCGHPHCRGHRPALGMHGGIQSATSAHGVLPSDPVAAGGGGGASKGQMRTRRCAPGRHTAFIAISVQCLFDWPAKAPLALGSPLSPRGLGVEARISWFRALSPGHACLGAEWAFFQPAPSFWGLH